MATIDPAIAKIQADMGGLKTQDDLNKYFATSGYNADQFAAAAPQYGAASDYTGAIAKGTAAYNATLSPVGPTFGGGGPDKFGAVDPNANLPKRAVTGFEGGTTYDQYKTMYNNGQVFGQNAGMNPALMDQNQYAAQQNRFVADQAKYGQAEQGIWGGVDGNFHGDTYDVRDQKLGIGKYAAPAGTSQPATTNTANSNSSSKIQADAVGLKTQADLNRYFATSGYTAEQLAAALPQYGGVADYQNAMAKGIAAYNGVGSGSSFSASSGTPQMNLAGLQGATNMGVDPKTQTVAGQLQSVLASDSPLIQQARTRALQSQNANGRLNSTMAAGAADAAMYDAALQIATPDANTYNLAAQTNAATANTFGRDANAFTRSQDMANFNVNANNWAAQQEAARQAARDKALNEQGVSNSDTATKNAAKVAATATYNNARAEFASKVSAISMNDTMDKNARAGAIEALRINYNSIITGAVAILGWDNPDSWLIKGAVSPPPTVKGAETTTPAPRVMDGG